MTKGQAGNQGGYDMYGFDWNGGTKTASNITNLNVIAGSYGSFNTATDQGPARVDTSVGDLFYVDNSDIYWAKKTSCGSPDGGTDGGGGEGGTSMDGGTDGGVDSGSDAGSMDGGVDSGTDSGAGGSDAGADSGMDAGTDSGSGGSDAGADGGSGGDSGMGGSDGGTGSDGGAGMDAGTDSGMGGMDAGTDSGTAGSDAGTAGSDSGTDAGMPAMDCKLINIINNPEDIKINNCNDNFVDLKLLGQSTFSIGNATFIITNVLPNTSGEFTFTNPKYATFASGIEKEIQENETDPNKKLVVTNNYNDQSGDVTGYEGTHTIDTIPDQFNPNKKDGITTVVASKTVDGLQKKFINTGCDPKQLQNCTPEDFQIKGANPGEIPSGTTLYTEVATGKTSTDPNSFNKVAPVQDNASSGGCSVNGHVDNTRNELGLLFMGLGIAAAVMRRRKQD